ncbi:MAG: radical SAM protein [Promethearchaeota archaeon]
MKIKESRGKSLYIGQLPLGCQHCIKGRKAVIFLGGACPKPEHCYWYCPISKERKDANALFVNEQRIESDEDLLDEIDAIGAKGISFTGGEPLNYNFSKVVHYLNLLKKEYNYKIHAHLYTTGLTATKEKLAKLSYAELDEIRFHPPSEKLEIIKEAVDYIPDVGVECPAIPTEKQTMHIKSLINLLEKSGGKFININEFEFSETNAKSLKARGFELKENTIAAVDGSEKMAMEILTWFASRENSTISVHYCPIITKDEYQLRNRYIRRGQRTKRSVEVLTGEGTVLFGRIKLKNNEDVQDLLTKINIHVKKVKNKIAIQKDKKEIHFHPSLLKNEDFFEILKFLNDVGIVEAIPTKNRDECEFTPIDTIYG